MNIRMNIRILTIILVIFCQFLFTAEADNKLEQVVKKLKAHGFPQEEIDFVFNNAKIDYEILVLRKKKTNYLGKAFNLFSPNSLLAGKIFIVDHFDVLSQAEKKYGVPKEVVVAILRVETNFGKFLGEKILINTFYSRILLNIKREEAEDELVSYLLLCRKMKLDPFSIKGSYMGCFGLPQFYPSSFLRYGVDGDKDGKIDLFCFPDAIFSIANYLKRKGWNGDFYSQLKALKCYNNSNEYVAAVMIYAFFLSIGKNKFEMAN